MEEQKIYELINENLGFYLATMDGDQPRVRPFGIAEIFENQLYIYYHLHLLH